MEILQTERRPRGPTEAQRSQEPVGSESDLSDRPERPGLESSWDGTSATFAHPPRDRPAWIPPLRRPEGTDPEMWDASRDRIDPWRCPFVSTIGQGPWRDQLHVRHKEDVGGPIGEAAVEAAAPEAQGLCGHGPGPVNRHPARRTNAHGVFRETDLEIRKSTDDDTARTRVSIRAIRDVRGWFAAMTGTLHQGSHAGMTEPLSIRSTSFETMTEALETKAEELILWMNETNEHRPRTGTAEAREIRENTRWIRLAIDQPRRFDRITGSRTDMWSSMASGETPRIHDGSEDSEPADPGEDEADGSDSSQGGAQASLFEG